jgi:recombination protein RecT
MSQAIVKRASDVLAERKDQFLAVLPRDVEPNRFYAIAVAIAKDPALAECTQSSVLSSIYRVAKLGLEADPVFGEVFVLPRKIKGVPTACLQMGYRGLTRLARKSRGVADIHAEVVYDGEPFEVQLGTGRSITHSPWFAGNAEPGEIRLAYCTWLDMESQRVQFHVVSPDRIKRAQDANSFNGKPSKIWETDTAAMVRKTAIIDASKFWPLSAELAEAIRLDEQADRGEAQGSLPEVAAITAAATDPAKSMLDEYGDEGSGGQSEATDSTGMTDAEKAVIVAREADEAKGGK